jgi:hypothetical protein
MLWGIFLMAQGASKNYGDMVALRFVSGMFEAVADPCFGEGLLCGGFLGSSNFADYAQ